MENRSADSNIDAFNAQPPTSDLPTSGLRPPTPDLRIQNAQKGYALLALIITLAIAAMLLASSVDTFHADTMRDKEEEFIFRGYEMAKAIARFNNAGRLGPLHLGNFPLKLDELEKQAEINGIRFLYVRQFALVDPITNDEWKPIRAGDPLIGNYLQNWTDYYGQPVPATYYQLSGGNIDNNGNNNGNPTVSSPNSSGKNDDEDDEDDEDDDEDDEDEDEDDSSQTPGISGQNGSGFQQPGGSVSVFGQNPGQGQPNNSPFVKFDDLDEDQRPIVGVVSKSKKEAYHRLLGKDVTYDKFLFIYLPSFQAQFGQPQIQLQAPNQSQLPNRFPTQSKP